jgi:hypothetical protein
MPFNGPCTAASMQIACKETQRCVKDVLVDYVCVSCISSQARPAAVAGSILADSLADNRVVNLYLAALN